MTEGVKTRRVQVWGRVQGIFFRDSARRHARKLHLTGYAKNLADGSVEIVAQGESAAIDELFTWAKHGPPFARVERFEITEMPSTETFDAFSIY